MPGRRAIPAGTQERYVKLRTKGRMSRSEAAQKVGVHYVTGKNWDEKFNLDLDCHTQAMVVKLNSASKGGRNTAQEQADLDESIPEPIPPDQLGRDASYALEDIKLFARRYFGAIFLPFHVTTVDKIVDLLHTPWEEYLLENIAPGAGKSYFKRIVGAWLTCHDRTLRGLMGSATQTLATKDCGALRTAFSLVQPMQADQTSLKHGITLDAEGCLARDFGRFAPIAEDPNVWREDGFRVAQLPGTRVANKELTWIAVGMDTKYIGTRVNIAAWDDPHDETVLRTLEAQEKMQERWESVAEARIETGGLLWVIQQRLGPGDLTSFCEAKTTADETTQGAERPLYHVIRYKAHYEDRCQGGGIENPGHSREAAPWPEGCLLFPRKIHWQLIERVSRQSNYRTVYQQEETDPAQSLVRHVWITGGVDPLTGHSHAGCWDKDRDLCEYPDGLVPPWFSVMSVDPSPTRFWALQWWLVVPDSDRPGSDDALRYLLDIDRRRMGANEFIDREFPSGDFVGLLPEWHERSVNLGIPIQYLIYERNAAQRFLLRTNTMQDFLRRSGINLIEHDTHNANKNAPEQQYGMSFLPRIYRGGLVRLPGGRNSRHKALQLVEEVTTYPHGTTDDHALTQWFLEWNLPHLAGVRVQRARKHNPSYVRKIPRAVVTA